MIKSFCYFVLLAGLVHASNWFASEPAFAKWSNDDLRTWLEQHYIRVPESFDKPHLYDLVDANWQSPLVSYAEAGRQWSLDQFNKAQRAFQHIKEDAFDTWDESRLRIFLLEQGVVAPSGPREQLVILAKTKYRAYTDAASLYSSLATGPASSAYAGATDTAHAVSECIGTAVAQETHDVVRAFDDTKDYVYSAWSDGQLRNWLEEHGIVEAKTASTRDELLNLANDYYRKAASAAWESWSDSYIREWLIAHNLLKPTDTLPRSSLLGEMKKYYYSCTDSVWHTWSDFELRAWLIDHGLLKSEAEKNHDELIRILKEQYLSASDTLWGAWADSDIHLWLAEHGYLENGSDVKSRKDLVHLISSKHPDASSKAASYLAWPDARLRAYLRERGVNEDALPMSRPGLLQETRTRWVQTTRWAEAIYARLKEIINNSVEVAEEKVARTLEVLSGHSRDVSRKADGMRECVDREKAHAWSWGTHKVDQARKKAEETRQRASESMARGKEKLDEL